MAEAGADSVLPVGSLFPVEGEGEEVRLLWGTAVRTERLGVSVRLMALSLSQENNRGVSLPQQDGGHSSAYAVFCPVLEVSCLAVDLRKLCPSSTSTGTPLLDYPLSRG